MEIKLKRLKNSQRIQLLTLNFNLVIFILVKSQKVLSNSYASYSIIILLKSPWLIVDKYFSCLNGKYTCCIKGKKNVCKYLYHNFRKIRNILRL